jgi:hypothetical protein
MAMSPITIESKSQNILKSNLISIEKNFTELYSSMQSSESTSTDVGTLKTDVESLKSRVQTLESGSGGGGGGGGESPSSINKATVFALSLILG